MTKYQTAGEVISGEPAKVRFERLMDAIEHGEVVPFLGAGISSQAIAPKGNGLGGQMHGSSIYNKLMLQVLRDCWRPDGTVDEAWWWFVKSDLKLELPDRCDPPLLPKDPNLLAMLEQQMKGTEANLPDPLPLLAQLTKYVKKTLSSPLAHLSELIAMRHGYVKLCEVLDLDRFTEIQPTPAHTALARLLLEGAFTEVITTNYDTCLERALARELGIDDSEIGNRGELPERLKRELDVVDRASSYLGADSGMHTRRRPRYYKINGCAGAWRRACAAGLTAPLGGISVTEHQAHARKRWRQAKRMILTERQLQTFRAERWAEEMFRDRARSGHLLFSGFGNEEPQIRHTALAIMREFEDLADEDREGNSEKRLWSLGAAPWFHQYSEQLQFFQMQVLHGWRHAWLREPGDPRDGDTTTPEGGNTAVPGAPVKAWTPPRNTFTEADRGYFGLVKDGLTADAFWEAILCDWWRRKYIGSWEALAGEMADIRLSPDLATPLRSLVEESAGILFHATRGGSSINTIQNLLRVPNPSDLAHRYQPINGDRQRTALLVGLIKASVSAAGSELRCEPISACQIRVSWDGKLPVEKEREGEAPLPSPNFDKVSVDLFVPSTFADLANHVDAGQSTASTDVAEVLRKWLRRPGREQAPKLSTFMHWLLSLADRRRLNFRKDQADGPPSSELQTEESIEEDDSHE